jgi:hypothetical protein
MGKRLQRYEHAGGAYIHKTISVIHLLEKRKSQDWEPKITGSGHHADKDVGHQALGLVTSSRVLGRGATKMTNKTREDETRAASLHVGCECERSFMSWRKVPPRRTVIPRYKTSRDAQYALGEQNEDHVVF